MEPWMRDAFWQGLWGGLFELLALGMVALWVNLIYQRIQSRQRRRADLIEEIDAFSHALYKPRKLYQAALDRPELFDFAPEGDRESLKAQRMQACLADLTEAAGRFRALQVKLVPLFGFDVQLFGFYLAIWRYLRQLRKRMERGESLYFHHESASSADAFYRLIDAFRYRVQLTKSARDKAQLITPPPHLLSEMEQEAEALYERYFGCSPEALEVGSTSAEAEVSAHAEAQLSDSTSP